MNHNNQLKPLFSDIIRGYSQINSVKFGKIFIKHFTILDAGEIDQQQTDYLLKAKDSGIPTIFDREEYIVKENLWSSLRNQEIAETESFILNLKVTKSKLFRQLEVNQIQTQIENNENKLATLKREKAKLIGFTAEQYAAKKINNYYIKSALFKDKNLINPAFTGEIFSEMEESDVGELISVYNENMSNFNESSLKKISISHFFVNFFYICNDDPWVFYGKPVIDLTFYQTELFSYGRYFKGMFANSEVKPPEEFLNDPDKLVDWFTSTDNAKKLLDKNQGADGGSLVGATKEDYAKMGVKIADPSELIKKAKEKGGRLGIEELMKIHS